MIYKRIYNVEDFKEEFRRYDRIDNFSEEAFDALFEFLDVEDESQELDVISICSDFQEQSFDDFISEHISIFDIPDALFEEIYEELELCFNRFSSSFTLVEIFDYLREDISDYENLTDDELSNLTMTVTLGIPCHLIKELILENGYEEYVLKNIPNHLKKEVIEESSHDSNASAIIILSDSVLIY